MSIQYEDAEALRKLYRQLPPLVWVATNAIKTNGPNRSMDPDDFRRFLDANDQVQQVLVSSRQIAG